MYVLSPEISERLNKVDPGQITFVYLDVPLLLIGPMLPSSLGNQHVRVRICWSLISLCISLSSALTSRFVLISSAFSRISLHRRLILYTCHFIIFVLVAFTSITFSLIQFRRKTQPVAFLFHVPSQHGLLLCMRSLATTYGLHTVAWTFSSPSPFLHPSVVLSVCPVCL